jgi:hypothetical protein
MTGTNLHNKSVYNKKDRILPVRSLQLTNLKLPVNYSNYALPTM